MTAKTPQTFPSLLDGDWGRTGNNLVKNHWIGEIGPIVVTITLKSKIVLRFSTILGIHYNSGLPDLYRALYNFIYSLSTFRKPVFSTIPEEVKKYKLIDSVI